MKIFLVYNPQAGSGRARGLIQPICDYLSQCQIEFELRLTEREGHATEIVAAEDLSQYDAIVASGGDGTLFEVVNGYQQNNGQAKAPLALLPNGTGNAFMKELGLKAGDWKRAVDIIAMAKPRKIDIGRFTHDKQVRYFINMVGMGFVTKVAHTAIKLKWLGNVSYTVGTLLKLINLKAQKMTLEIDGKQIVRQGVFVEVANSTFTGTNFLMAPKAKLDDGLLDVVLLNDISRFRLLRLFTSIYDGSHINYPELEYFQAKSITVEEENPDQLIPDGEVMAGTPVTFECLPKAVDFLWDPALVETK